MARSEAKRQKRLAKQKAKRNQKRREIKQTKQMGLAEQLTRFETAPVIDSLVNSSCKEQGIANLLITRQSASGEVAVGSFLVDPYCMGVKDCYGKVMAPGEYKNHLEKFRQRDVRPIDPPSLKRLVEDALAYAHSLGLSPHPDFRKVRPILNGIDSDDAEEIFEMGKDGKPFFFAGPGQSPQDCRRILTILENHCGPDGYDYMMPVGGSGELDFEGELIEEDEDDFERIDDVKRTE